MKIRPITDPLVDKKVRKFVRARMNNHPHLEKIKEKTWKLISEKMKVNISESSSNALAFINGQHMVLENFTTKEELLDFSYGFTDEIDPLKKVFLSQLNLGEIDKCVLNK